MNIIVTGASRGIGFETAKLLSQDTNNQVLAISRNVDGLKKLLPESNVNQQINNIQILPFDLVKGNYEELIRKISAKMIKVDILVNMAGALVNKPFGQLDDDDFDLLFQSNVKSIFKLTRLLLPYFSQNAHIVNIGSMGGVQGSIKFPGLSLYSASKGAVATLTECLAVELKDLKISVNCLALGSAQTEMLAEAFPGYQATVKPKDMALFIGEFALKGHKVMNGKIIPVSLSNP